MSNFELNQIFIAHPARFVCSAVQEFSKLKGVSTYVIDDFNDFSYLIEDLKPQVFVIHEATLIEQLEQFENGIKKFPDLKIIVITDKGESKLSDKYTLKIQEPFDPKDLCGNITQLLETQPK